MPQTVTHLRRIALESVIDAATQYFRPLTWLGEKLSRMVSPSNNASGDIHPPRSKESEPSLEVVNHALPTRKSAGRSMGETGRPTTFSPRLLIVDPHVLVTAGLAAVLKPAYRVAATARSGEEALEALGSGLVVDCVITELSMPGMGGLDLLSQLHLLYPSLPVIVVTLHGDQVLAKASIRLGARGYIHKAALPALLGDAISVALQGGVFVAHDLGDPRSARTQELLARLTPRQRAIAYLFATGLSVDEIADELHVSRMNLELQRTRIRQQLGIESDLEFQRLIGLLGGWEPKESE